MVDSTTADPFTKTLCLANDGSQTAVEPMEFSRGTSIDSMDHACFFMDMDDDTDRSQANMSKSFDDIWRKPDSPEPEQSTSDALNMEDNNGVIEDSDFEPEPFKYHLRPQTRDLKAVFTRTWIDRDESGNYGEKDPNEENRKRRKQNRVKIQLRTGFDPNGEEVDEERPDRPRSSKVFTKFVLTLPFTSEAAKARFRETINVPPRQPQGQPDEVNSNGYKLRKRGSSSSTRYNGECNLVVSKSDPDLSEDLTGYPAARGCLECLGLGIRCPLLDNERQWPCDTCLIDERDCVLVTQPKFKRACERCKARRRACSYTYTYEHGEACQQCMDDGYRCIAGPAKDTIRTRIRYDIDWNNNPPPKEKPFKARKPPIAEEFPKQTMLEEFTMTPPDIGKKGQPENEAMANMDDDPLVRDRDPPKHEHTSVFHKRRHNQEANSRHTKAYKSNKGSRGKTYKINTKFCHPIIFNHEDDGTSTSCHFCSDPSYAIFGLGGKEVEVIEWEDGRGLEEVSGGHKGEGVENTRVCISCTTHRIPIIMCREHELMPFRAVDNDKFDENDAFSDLLSGSNRLRGRWCSVCPNLARYECCTPGDDGAGCGLLVCEHCMALLAGMYDSNLQKMLPELTDEPTQERMLGLRADHELLREDGLLMKHVLWNSQQ